MNGLTGLVRQGMRKRLQRFERQRFMKPEGKRFRLQL